MLFADILGGGFGLAHRRIGFLLLDILWKIIWLVVSLVGLYIAVLWITSDVLAISWDDTANRTVNAFIAMQLLREFWATHRGEILIVSGLLVVSSAFIWILLEALFRRKLVVPSPGERPGPGTPPTLWTLVASNVA